MRRAARTIVINNANLLVMHRNKFGTEYDTLPGGEINIGEEPIDAAVRETKEETCIEIANPRLVFLEHAGDIFGDQYVFLCEYVSGEPVLDAKSTEFSINEMGNNLYQPRWLPLKSLDTTKFVSEKLKSAILDCISSGWPEKAIEITS